MSGDVDLCLVPEVAIELEGERGCLPFLKQRVAEQGMALSIFDLSEADINHLNQRILENDENYNQNTVPMRTFFLLMYQWKSMMEIYMIVLELLWSPK